MGFAGSCFSTYSRTPATRSPETVPSTRLMAKSWRANCRATFAWEAIRRIRGSDVVELARGGLAVAVSVGIREVLRQHPLGRRDDKAGDLRARLGEHLLL